MAVAMKDGKLYCEFTRPKAMSVVNMFNDTEMITFDINKEYYVMIAWGFTHRGMRQIYMNNAFFYSSPTFCIQIRVSGYLSRVERTVRNHIRCQGNRSAVKKDWNGACCSLCE